MTHAAANRPGPIAAPTAFPAAGRYGVTQMVTLLCATPGAAIHYTLDGSAPGPASPVFDPELLISTVGPDSDAGPSMHHLRAVAIRAGRQSAEASFHYQIDRRAKDAYLAEETAAGVWTIRDYDDDKMYLLAGTRKALLIDAGMGTGDLRSLVEARTRGLPLEVVITHAHPDHLAALAQFQQDCPVYMHPADRPLLDVMNAQFGFGIDPGRIRDLGEGDVFDLGGRRLEVFEVPGHSPGSVVLLDKASGDLFAADAVGNNRPTIVDALWLQLPGMALIDEYLASLQGFRSRTAGLVKAIYTGHNDRPLGGDRYLDQLERAAQKLVDLGVDALTPAARPAGAWQVSSGDRLTDPNWAAILVDRGRFLSADPDQIATLSNLVLRGARLNERFHPARAAYSAQLGPASVGLEITATATSSRHQSLTINGRPARSGIALAVELPAGGGRIEIAVRSPDGSQERGYTLAISPGTP